MTDNISRTILILTLSIIGAIIFVLFEAGYFGNFQWIYCEDQWWDMTAYVGDPIVCIAGKWVAI